MTRREWKIYAAKLLPQDDSPLLTAELLLCYVLEITRSQLIAHDSEILTSDRISTLNRLLRMRILGEPLAYITGSREFYGRDFFVSPSVLIPRPETESLIDYALRFFPSSEPVTFLDLGTGSGCIAITLLTEKSNWIGYAVDISEEALSVAQRNAELHGQSSRISFSRADFREVLPFLPASFDLVISNPPYISGAEYKCLDQTVRDFEPECALLSEENGLSHCSAVEKAARRLLRSDGLFLMEHGWQQGSACRSLCSERYWRNISTGVDLAGRERFLIATRRFSHYHQAQGDQ